MQPNFIPQGTNNDYITQDQTSQDIIPSWRTCRGSNFGAGSVAKGQRSWRVQFWLEDPQLLNAKQPLDESGAWSGTGGNALIGTV